MKRLCLKMYVNGMGVRGISRVTDIAHTTILNWIAQSGELLPEGYDPKQIPQVGELDELETYVGKKQHSAETFRLLWAAICIWQCYFWVSDGN